MSKKVACYILHYGKEWLYWSMRSVFPFVDQIRIFYTPKPSHGHSTELVCPESGFELKEIANEFKAAWHSATYRHEGDHRDFAYNSCGDADIVLIVDADEIWLPEQLRFAFKYVEDSGLRNWRVNMLHFWRSVDWVCEDNMWPMRLIVNKAGSGDGYLPNDRVRPLHMGYAQSPDLVGYKISIHGHKTEFRKGWFEKVFKGWKPGDGDVHPTCVNTWTPVRCNRDDFSDVIGDHPFFRMEIIQ